MLIWKVLLQILAVVLALLVTNLDYIWHDKRTLKFKRTRLALYVFSGAFLIISIVVTVQSERKADRESQELRVKLGELTHETQAGAKLVKELQNQLQPFITLAREKYPSPDLDESLKSLHSDLQKIHERTTKLETAEAATRPRSLIPSQMETLVKVLSDYKGTPIGIKYRANDTESYNYALQFKEVFATAGWRITRVAMTFYYSPVYGLELGVKTDPASEAALAITAYFEQQGIDIKHVVYSEQTESILLRVGQK